MVPLPNLSHALSFSKQLVKRHFHTGFKPELSVGTSFIPYKCATELVFLGNGCTVYPSSTNLSGILNASRLASMSDIVSWSFAEKLKGFSLTGTDNLDRLRPSLALYRGVTSSTEEESSGSST